MSEGFILYVVNEDKLPTQMDGLSDREKYEKLVDAVKTTGSQWETLEMGVLDFAEALETIDEYIGETGFLPVFAFNNSPHDVLGPDSEAPSFGYFNPSQAQDLHDVLESLPPELVEDLLSKGDLRLEKVFYAFKSAAEEASKRGYALAIIHT